MTNSLFDSGQEKELPPKEPDFEKGLNILSLFDGLSGGQIALDRLNIKVDNYYASEIDKYAIQVAKHNYPDTKHLGSVIDLKEEDLLKMNIDMLIGGSPCQSFSRSGDGTGFDGKSKLFWEYIRVLKTIKPKYFLLENVMMKKEWEEVITEAMGVQPIQICSSLVSAQKRQRLFWTNIPNIKQPEDKNITLSDIVTGDREIIEDNPLVLDTQPKLLKIRNATKQGYLYAKEGDSVNLEVPTSKTRRGRVGVGKTNTLNTACNYGMVKNGKLVRLNINDYEALQTIPKDYTATVSENQRRKMIGNGWTIDVMCHIFKNIIPKNKKVASQKIDEKWLSETIRLGKCIVSYTQEDDEYVWIYFAYSDSKRDFKRMVDYLKVKFYGMIVEYKTQKPLLFASHSSHQGNDIYRWEH